MILILLTVFLCSVNCIIDRTYFSYLGTFEKMQA
jgi:hypothetical protein